MEKLGDSLKRLREAKGLNQVELGALLGVSNKSISRYESGEVEPKLDILLKLTEIFAVDANFLLDIRNIYRTRHVVVNESDIELLERYHALSDGMKAAVDTILLSRQDYHNEVEHSHHFVSETEE
ncbi:MAG: helix-turn-helix transcriptional regulator [Erysipelotrichaceae bacterium]